MTDFFIPPTNKEILKSLQQTVNNKTKPLGALGKLEDLAIQIGLIQNTLTPVLNNPHIIVFAGSHGIADEKVSAYPKEVTHQMVLNFIKKGAAINVFTQQNGIELTLVDAGVDFDFGQIQNLTSRKVNKGTRSFLTNSAMTVQECLLCFEHGKDVVESIRKTGCNVIGFGEMGIGNTSAASCIMSKLLDLSLDQCIGRGTGLNEEQFLHKKGILERAIQFHVEKCKDPITVLRAFGGFEMAMMCSAMLTAAKERMIVLVDGFIATVVYLCAFKINPQIKEYAIFCHQSEEAGHKLLLEMIEAKALVNLNMRLGEGTGCAVAYPIIKAAVSFINNMASFEEAGVSNKS